MVEFIITHTSKQGDGTKIEVESLEQMLDFIKRIKEEVIITPPGYPCSSFKDAWVIEIYDDYR